MTTVSAWGKPGAWALDSEENEAIEAAEREQQEQFLLKQQQQQQPLSDFPSLATAVSSKPSKKKKAQPLSLSEFTTGKQVTHGAAKSRSSEPTTTAKRLTADELSMLPTGPRERTAEELEHGTRGFRSFGAGRENGFGGGFGGRRENSDGEEGGRWGGGGSRAPSRVPDGPSRADETDDWGAGKKSSLGFERRERERDRGFFDSQSRADESDNWGSNKSFVPAENRRSGGGGGGGFENYREKESSRFGGRSGFDFLSAKPDSDSWGKKGGDEVSSGGRPKLVLQPRTVVVASDGELQQGGGGRSKGLNPFGAARPREEVLAEKGQDWKKIEEKLDAVKIKESDYGSESVGRRSFGSGNGRVSFSEDRMEGSWRKRESVDTTTAVARVEKADGAEAEV